MEPRQLLSVSASPIHVGAVYFEDSSINSAGSTLNGKAVEDKIFSVSFTGGEAGTQLTTLTIDTREAAYFTDGNAGDLLGNIKNLSNYGIQITSATLTAQNELVLTLTGFTANESLIFSVNIDEAGGDLRVTGNEFSTNTRGVDETLLGSQLTATFTSPYAETITTNSLDFTDAFNDKFAAAGVTGILPDDNYGNAAAVAATPVGAVADAVETAGACGGVTQTLLPVAVSGKVLYSPDADVTDTSSETGISGVTLTLWQLNTTTSQWQQVTKNSTAVTTTTGSDGSYSFTNLDPGSYQVRMDQGQSTLGAYTDLATLPGAGSSSDTANVIATATLKGGQSSTENDFVETKLNSVSGHVYMDINGDGQYEAGIDKPIPNTEVTLVTSGGPIVKYTDANGFYSFTNLWPGAYTVIETQPKGYNDGPDYHNGALSTTNDYFPSIKLTGNVAGVNYDFTEVLPNNPPPPPPPTPPNNPSPPLTPPDFNSILTPATPSAYVGDTYVSSYYSFLETPLNLPAGGAGGPPAEYTWHLSVIDAGQPRSEYSGEQVAMVGYNRLFDPISWSGADMNEMVWTLADKDGKPTQTLRFGAHGGTPVVGDWDGSGFTKIGMFLDGIWFLDLNGNGAWDAGDLWIKLGAKGDQPVAGDWNGDGKTDIGIFGPEWTGDPQAIAAEPGLPSSQNPPAPVRPKNMPPDATMAPVGYRTLKKGTAGKLRSDVIDHVFQFGKEGDIVVTGDWSGDGIYTIGVFRKGTWYLDMNGNGRWDEGDVAVQYGQEGDLPVVGDWTGDGITKLGVYRNGTFYLDTNNNRQMDAADKVFALGGPGDKPIAGDWTGDGITKVGVVHSEPAAPQVPLQAQRH
jgi:hypothetical protein